MIGDIDLTTLPDWRLDNNSLVASFVFPSFVDVMKCINAVAAIAEEQQHHPEWRNVYTKLSFRLTTHDAENTITAKDIDLARAISACVAAYGGMVSR